ncbi:DUF3383 family protein [Tropicimonas sp. IMCC34011]|uniref:DUF3383 family protein n=1 Tax=Tropicimonas sp. IMCC34011 TaxID=2248759 RepID=UPI000E2716B4|nr:DUF3383 family protein [Tropicimonas sp. IMCC34011]
MTLPASLVVNVTVRANDRFPPRRGFGIPLFLTSVTKAGKLTSDIRTRAYGSMPEVANDWDAADAFYKAAQFAFSQNPRPSQIKVAYYDPTDIDAAGLSDELDAIRDYDANWFWAVPEATLRDTAALQGLIDWTETEERIAVIASNDPNLKDSADATNIAAVNKDQVINTAVVYSSTAAEYPDMALAATLAARSLDQADSHYTAAFKRLRLITPENIPVSDFNAITGLTAGVGADDANGHCANVYVEIGELPQLQTGMTLTPNTFIDEVHFRYWLAARGREKILSVFANNDVVPYDDLGIAMLTSAIREVMLQAQQSGHIARVYDDENGEFLAPYTITAPEIADIDAAQRQARVFPTIEVGFRYAGAVHFASVEFSISY